MPRVNQLFRPPALALVIALWTLSSVFGAAEDSLHCHVFRPHDLSDAEKAYLFGDARNAEVLYREALAKSPHDTQLLIGLVRTLLREQKTSDANTMIQAELALAPTSVGLLTTLGEVEYQQGYILESATTADKGLKADPCSPRLYLLRAKILRLNSMYASERRAIAIARLLDPSDQEIKLVWIGTLPIKQRIEEQKKFLAAQNSLTSEEKVKSQHRLATLISEAGNPDKTCHLVSPADSAQIPIVPLRNGVKSTGEWGLDVSFNGVPSRLDIDTGATGLLISPFVAERAGLQAVSHIQIGGIGDQGDASAHTAYADSVRIGSLEFHDCLVEVNDRKGVLDSDGLIGADVFSNYLITLDYPNRKLSLSPLPHNAAEIESPTSLNTLATDESSGKALAAAAQGSGPPDRYISQEMKNYFPFFRREHFILIPTVLNHKIQRLFLVDTGAYSSFVSTETAREVTKVRGGPPIAIVGMSGAVRKVSTSDKIVLQFAGIEQENDDLLGFDTSFLSKAAGLEVSGMLGDTILRQLSIHIDYRDGLIKFDYDPRHHDPGFAY